jgi:hypothetical protein
MVEFLDFMHTQQTNKLMQDIPPLPQHDTTRSLRVMKNVLVWLLSAIAVPIGFFVGYSDKIKGDSNDDIAEFDASLRGYVRAAKLANFQKLESVEYYSKNIPTLVGLRKEAARLERAQYNLHYDNQYYARAKINQTFAEYNFAQSSNEQDLRVHSDEALSALEQEWIKKNTGEALLTGLGVAAMSGIGTWIAVWLLAFVFVLIWWFMMDRLRDISRAIKGK